MSAARPSLDSNPPLDASKPVRITIGALWATVAVSLVGATAWAVTRGTVADHTRRIEEIESSQKDLARQTQAQALATEEIRGDVKAIRAILENRGARGNGRPTP